MLLTVINGDPDARDDVSVPSAVTEEIRDKHGDPVLEEFRKVANLPDAES